MLPDVKGEESIFSKSLVLTLVALLCCALWGSATPAIKIGYESLKISGVSSIMLFAGIRFFLAGLLTIFIFSIARKRFLFPKKESWGRIVSLSSVQTVAQYVLYYIGLSFTSGVKATVACGMGTFFSVLIASLIFKQEKLSLKKIIACVMGFCGVLVINLNGVQFSADGWDLLGVALVIFSTVAYALSSVLIKRYSDFEDPVVLSGYQFLIGGAVMALIGLVTGGTVSFENVFGVVDLVYLGFVSAVAYSLWGVLLKYNPVSRVTVFSSATPVFGALLTMLLVPSESSNVNPVNLVIALLLVPLGILLLNYQKSQKRKEEKEREI